MDRSTDPVIPRLAMTIAATAVGSVACIAAYSVAGGPLGTLNDLGNAAVGVLSGVMAWRLRDSVPGRVGGLAVGAAMAGGAVTVVGSALVISGVTSWFLAGQVSSVGFAGIGAFVALLNGRGTGDVVAWPSRLRTLGMVAGSLMVIGVASLPAIAQRLDDAGTAPWWAWVTSVGWLGTYVAYPAWAAWMARVARSQAGATGPAPALGVGGAG